MSIIISFTQRAPSSEILGQALFVPILFIALHYGRQLGFMAATSGAMIYLIARVEEINNLNLLTQDGRSVMARAVLFGLIGIFGSELATRSKYLIAGLAGGEHLEDQTHLYSQAYLQKSIARLFSEYHRHARPFSILFVTLDWTQPSETAAREKLIGKVANIMRSHVRLIDEVGYLSDNCFCLVLPETPVQAARLVFERLEKAYLIQATQMAVYPKMICERVLNMPENEAEIKAMLPERDLAKFIA
ncbi:MAG: diguanylate cyclase [Actinomycetota bacterium]|nr:diguanylate cyclase [Actinomycetota bacterium]